MQRHESCHRQLLCSHYSGENVDRTIAIEVWWLGWHSLRIRLGFETFAQMGHKKMTVNLSPP